VSMDDSIVDHDHDEKRRRVDDSSPGDQRSNLLSDLPRNLRSLIENTQKGYASSIPPEPADLEEATASNEGPNNERKESSSVSREDPLKRAFADRIQDYLLRTEQESPKYSHRLSPSNGIEALNNSLLEQSLLAQVLMRRNVSPFQDSLETIGEGLPIGLLGASSLLPTTQLLADQRLDIVTLATLARARLDELANQRGTQEVLRLLVLQDMLKRRQDLEESLSPKNGMNVLLQQLLGSQVAKSSAPDNFQEDGKSRETIVNQGLNSNVQFSEPESDEVLEVVGDRRAASVHDDDEDHAQSKPAEVVCTSPTRKALNPCSKEELKDQPPQEQEKDEDPQYEASHFVTAPLGKKGDELWLSAFLCFVRAELVEVFIAQKSSRSPSPLDQIGFRCRFCANVNPRFRVRRSSSFPSSISRIYQSLTMMLRDHFPKCQEIPSNLQSKFGQLRATSIAGAADSKYYWISSAQDIGLTDTKRGIGVDAKKWQTHCLEVLKDAETSANPQKAQPHMCNGHAN